MTTALQIIGFILIGIFVCLIVLVVLCVLEGPPDYNEDDHNDHDFTP